MLVGNKAPANFVVNFTAVSIHIELSMLLKLGFAAKAICAHQEVPIACRFITVVIFSQQDVPFLEGFYPISTVWYAVFYASDSRLPVNREEVLKSCIGAGSCLLNEQMKWENAIDDL